MRVLLEHLSKHAPSAKRSPVGINEVSLIQGYTQRDRGVIYGNYKWATRASKHLSKYATSAKYHYLGLIRFVTPLREVS